nr:hypothetical protein [uncultured Chitinophaga sp.]
MKYLLLSILLPFAAQAQTEVSTPPAFSVPANYKKVAEATGDLDKDEKDEVVLIYDSGPDKKDYFERILYICRNTDGKLSLWRKKVLAVLPVHSAPAYTKLRDLKISRNCIILKQEEFPGGRNLTLSTHIFRFQQDDWYLIGSKTTLNTNCYGAQISEVNFSTGDVIVAFEPDGGCDGEENQQPAPSRQQYKHTFTSLPLLDKLKLGENTLKIPGCKENVYY